jgi:peroxiredoxin
VVLATGLALATGARLARGGGEASAPGTARSDSVRDFTRVDLDGKPRSLSEWRGARVVVLAWTAPGCPVAGLYAPRLATLAKEYEARGVRFVGMASGEVDVAEAKRLARDAAFGFPILLDEDAAIAQRLGV